ncbi:flagellar biosynthesis anti-sigma factor FlgM [Shewanella mesophila]|uniref:flagellar biosynthesis anti-sigma factor FlgM n=1 Tax=Shewanella mesophila TaxID=2864208 RepID=UPI001C65955B|nr:flagellar biosynthesis anti-sigma factor FlgM [Shewanella mesophila]QYJ85071.1 flagellar biosynthesis anti-sigma factor FlgM [Shewanella mesophila]
MAINIKQVNTGTNNRIATPSASTSSQSASTSSQAKAPAQSVKSDSVSITSQAQQLQSVQAKLSNIPEIDLKKVEEIKTAIAEGRYKVDADKLASNIAQFENELQDLN